MVGVLPAAEEGWAAFRELAMFVSTKLQFTYPDGRPTIVEPDTINAFRVRIEGVNGGTFKEGSGRLLARVGTSGDFEEFPLTPLGNDLFEATLPAAPCDEVVQFYVEAETTENELQTSPFGAPLDRFEARSVFVEEFFVDDFEADKGWAVEDIDLTDGGWQRGVPAGDGTRGDPTGDFDGSGQCYLTGNREGNSDVDGGPTRLTSPTIDLSGADDATISYARWFYNDDSDQDSLDVEISNDNGANWTLVERVQRLAGGWVHRDFLVSDFVTPTSEIVVRFSATDNPNDSITEAAIDAFDVSRTFCETPECLGLEVQDLIAGREATFTTTKASPGSTVAVLYSRQLGEFNANLGEWCVDFGLDIAPSQARSRIVVQGVADSNGQFEDSLDIPGIARGLELHFQAAERGTCPESCMSNIVSGTVQ